MATLEYDSSDRLSSGPEEAAARWVVAVDKGLTSAQEREFSAWLGADPEHRALFEEMGGTWAVMGQADVAATAESTVRRSFWRRAGKLALPLAAAAALAIGYLSWWRPAHYAGTAATEVGGHREMALPDGSIVELNTDSEVVAAFSPDERRVRLEKGEAHFRVAKNRERPFVVEAGGVDVRAVGTAFNVRLKRDRVDVLVTEGRVRVQPEQAAVSAPAEPREVGAGEQLSVALGTVPEKPEVPVAVPAEAIQRTLAWQQRKLDFADATLGEMVAEFNRYNTHKVEIADDALAAQRFGGMFRADDPAGFVRMLQVNFHVVVEERAGVTVLKAPR